MSQDVATQDPQVEKDRQLILEAKRKGPLAKLAAYTRLSGPGWLQSAITLGGGSLSSSLYLGILAGFAMMWLQPLAMIFGVIMLSAIGYVALSTRERPFQAINRHVNPVLGWGWALATMAANLVWALPQFSLGTAAVRQNLLKGLFDSLQMAPVAEKAVLCGGILLVSAVVVWFYDKGGWGIKVFETILKIMVAVVVLSFFGVVVKMSAAGVLDWGRIVGGLVPDPRLLFEPAKTFAPYLEAAGPQVREFWRNMIVDQQQDVMVSAAATAVGINMTFLLPYSMLKKGWDKDFRGLAIFDLSTGLFIPFILATGCVVMASAAQFHTEVPPGFLVERDADGALVVPEKALVGKFEKIAWSRAKHGEPERAAEVEALLASESETDREHGAAMKREMIEALPEADRRMAAILIQRDAYDLAQSLEPLTGRTWAHYVFGVGVIGMAVSSVIILMLINGFVVCEMAGRPSQGWLYKVGCLLPGLTGFMAPFIWTGGRAQFWLAMPTSVFGFMLIPIAYITFALVMNSRGLLGERMPRGRRRWAWNVLMLVAAGTVGFCALLNVWKQTAKNLGSGWWGMAAIAAFGLLALVVHVVRKARATRAWTEAE